MCGELSSGNRLRRRISRAAGAGRDCGSYPGGGDPAQQAAVGRCCERRQPAQQAAVAAIARAASDRDYRRLLRTGLRVERGRAAPEIALAVAQAHETVREQPVGVAFY
jgi:hypothetical protein